MSAATLRKKKLHLVQGDKDTATNTTCRDAVEHGTEIGSRIFWRPGGVVNWMLPELDRAQILEV